MGNVSKDTLKHQAPLQSHHRVWCHFLWLVPQNLQQHLTEIATITSPQTRHTWPRIPQRLKQIPLSLPQVQHNTHVVNTTIQLPRLDLPNFSGKAREWQSFWDGFEAAVHDNPAIYGVQKQNYLRSLLCGEACPLEWELWTLRSTPQGSPHKLITAHMQAFINLPTVCSPFNTIIGLQKFHDIVERHVCSLTTLGKFTELYEDILMLLHQQQGRIWQENMMLMNGILHNCNKPLTSKKFWGRAYDWSHP